MEGRAKVTKDILAEEGRFILANVLAEGRFSRQSTVHDIRKICENAVTLPFGEYLGFLESAGYLRQNPENEILEVTTDGARVANGDNLVEFAERAVTYFRGRRKGKYPTRDKRPPPAAAMSALVAEGELRTHGEIVDTRYEKLAKVGSGGIGTVYRARQVPLNREVALKEIRDLFSYFSDDQRDEIIRRFTDVVQAAASLAHPNILPLHDVNLDREFPYVVSELAPNGSARRLIADAEDLPIAVVLKYLLQTSHALQAAHNRRVFHRGLKPENLLIDGHGNVKVSDFGFGRIVERDSAVIRQVYVGIGSVAYMAPELFTDPVSAGPQADIYALGIIFYELLTRRLPGRRSPMPSQINSKLPKEIDDIFDKMTRDSRSERYASVDDILDDFERVKGLADILDKQTQVMVAENPLEGIRFRESQQPKEQPLEPEDSNQTIDDVGLSAEAKEGDGKDDRKAVLPRPYSFQQRKKKS
jgi:serine/threonine protein kinase